MCGEGNKTGNVNLKAFINFLTCTVEPTGSGSERISEKKIVSEQGEEFDSLAANQKRLKIQNVLLERMKIIRQIFRYLG